MEIWCDSAQVDAVACFAQHGWLHGVTTNPKILSSNLSPAALQIAKLLEVQAGPVAVQVSATTEEGMLMQAKKLHGYSQRLLIKIPMTSVGIKVLAQLKSMGIPTLATGVFSAEQFLLAAKLGADYVAPYLHQMNKQGIDAIEELSLMQDGIRHYHLSTKVMAASIQDLCIIKNLISLGVNSVTLTPACLNAWIENTYTNDATKTLNEAWEQFPKQFHSDLFSEVG
ncbi:MAG: hypothetical protein HYX61_11710 [Gammaproteobacteria bacterium]|nr:hypothetical protein [Gammaproteobacteria bacterium]